MNLKLALYLLVTLFYVNVSLANNTVLNESSFIDTSTIETQNFVMLQYHHVSTTTPPVTSISPADFKTHMAYLKDNHTVISLDQALTHIKTNTPLPNKSVVITFDDGYVNILENAHPILVEYNFPYTIFINPAIIGETTSQLNWEQVKSMQPLATFANHTLDHAHLLTRYGSEHENKWLKRVMKDVNQAEELITENLGYSKKWLAYPYGEFNSKLKEQLLEGGYIGFGQQSGAVSHFSDFGALPRFPAAGIYASLNSLKTKLDSLAMPAKLVSPSDVEFKPGETLSHITLQVLSEDVRLNNFACYFKGKRTKIKIDNSVITAMLDHQLSPGRNRVNCTAPSKRLGNRFYWYSFPMFTPTENGDFLE